MKATHKILIFTTNFALGLLLPVMSLMLIARGCMLQTLGLAVGAFAVAVIVAELPTGIFADLYGRKISFLIACALNAASCMVLLFSASFVMAAGGLVLTGIGTAFASGSADALIIEATLAQSGDKSLNKVVGAMRACEGAGLMAGAVAGGFIPNVENYMLHILTRMALVIAAGIWAWFVLHEARVVRQARVTLRAHLAGMSRLIFQVKEMLLVFTCAAAFGFLQFLLETYWQPQLGALTNGGSQVLLGLLCTGGFGAAAAGSFIIGRVKAIKMKWYWVIYLSLGVVVSALIALLSQESGAVGFALVYVAVYMVIGMIAVSEQTIVNGLTPDDIRASILSLMSFTVRAGGVLSSIVAATLIAGMRIGSVWLIGSVFTAVCFAAVAFTRGILLKRSVELPDAL